MRNRIIFLTECGAGTGFGHLTRCMAIAEAFRSAGWVPEFWVATDDRAAGLPPGTVVGDWYDLPDDAAKRLGEATAVMVDSLVASPAQMARLTAVNPRFAVIDDWRRLAHPRGIVIDWTIGAERFAYPDRNAGVCYLLGSRFCALRPAFGAVRERSFPDEPAAVMITFGGSDPRALTGPVLAALAAAHPHLHLHVVVGAAVRERGYEETQRSTRVTFHHACDAARMAALMEMADFAVCAGGQTLYELAALGLPPIVVCAADNQTDDLREFAAMGFAAVAGDWSAPDLTDRILTTARALAPAAERRRRSACGRACVDGHGAGRLVRACLERWELAPTLVGARG
jgi:spore coat polysaccharide biosynthesis predicted glycosyltransferase SpsG